MGGNVSRISLLLWRMKSCQYGKCMEQCFCSLFCLGYSYLRFATMSSQVKFGDSNHNEPSRMGER